jgi:predicted signal transduction protein with EAL and GGDEF domain
MKSFPLSALKIDRSFVHNCGTDPTNRALVAAIISMGHALGLQVTAEGVETASELTYLREQKCDRAQGTYFSRPVPSTRLPGVLTAKTEFRGWPARAKRPATTTSSLNRSIGPIPAPGGKSVGSRGTRSAARR